ncbi:MAG TPA: 5'-nucleotidase C-terminal domain-containing protein [Drouetiella sp.]|jgi:5'-nucleotidase / UDP-sugar diphosphatase
MPAEKLNVQEQTSALFDARDSSQKWRDELGSVHFRQAATEVASSIAAGTSGAIAYGLLSASGPYGKALSIPVAMLAGGATKFGAKSGLQEAFLNEKDRTLSSADIAWGAVDGLSGISASVADQRASRVFLQNLGQKELGVKTSVELSGLAGKQLVEGNAWNSLKHNVFRGLAGGAAGSATWSAFRETHDNWNQITNDPVNGIAATVKGVAIDTAVGTIAGGAFGGGLATLRRSPELIGRTIAGARGENNHLQLNEFVINDFHSNLDRLPQIQTKLTERTAASASKGIPSEFNVAGDALSGHVNFASTNGGVVENRALAKMGLKNIIPGNHEYDSPGGRFVPERYPTVMAPVLGDNPQLSLLNANLDLSAYPDYAKLTKPYVVHEIQGPNGPEKVATVGLITRDGAVGKIRYEDASETAIKTVQELNAQGIKNIKLLTHLGLEEDKKLAQTLLDNNLVVAKISGGHTHDVLASPLWVTEKQTLADKLQFWKTPKAIPITQAGSNGDFLAENHIVFNNDGSANRWLTTGRLHSMQDVPADPNLKAFIDGQTAEIKQLKATIYDASATQPYEIANSRNSETALGNLIADATLSGLQKRMGADAPQIAMVHSGGIRSSIPADQPLTRLDLANVFMNAGRVEGEQQELVMVTLSGKNIRDSIEYGIREYPATGNPSLRQRLSEIVQGKPDSKFDESGNFVQVSGMKYSIDLTKEPWHRVTDVSLKMPDGTYQPMQETGSYTVVTRFHPVDKWHKAGLFGDGIPEDQIYAKLNGKAINVSQVDLLGEFVQGRKLNPQIDSKVEGRINNVTPTYTDIAVRPQPSIVGYATLAAQDATYENQENH